MPRLVFLGMKVLKWPAGGSSYGQAPLKTLPPPAAVPVAAPVAALAAGFGASAPALGGSAAGVTAGGAWQAASAAAAALAPAAAISRRRLRANRFRSGTTVPSSLAPRFLDLGPERQRRHAQEPRQGGGCGRSRCVEAARQGSIVGWRIGLAPAGRYDTGR